MCHVVLAYCSRTVMELLKAELEIQPNASKIVICGSSCRLMKQILFSQNVWLATHASKALPSVHLGYLISKK